MSDQKTHLDIADQAEQALLERAIEGHRSSLEHLVKLHQGWIYNIVLRMVWYPPEAEDITQEILIKMVTNLGTFRRESSFRTWLYRVAVNHVMKSRKQSAEKNWFVRSFEDYGRSLDEIPDGDLPHGGSLSVDASLLVTETRLKCKMGMLLCLKRDLRMVFILGAVFGMSDVTASEILEISRENYRQRLSRARRKIRNFLEERCELVNENSPCKCHRKTRALVELGNIDPSSLLFNRPNLKTVEEVIRTRSEDLCDFDDTRCDTRFREDPFQQSPDFATSLQSIIKDSFYGTFR